MGAFPISNGENVCYNIFGDGEIDEGFTTEAHAQLSFLVSPINADNAEGHSSGDLDAHMSYTTASTDQYTPVARFEPRLFQLKQSVT